MADYGQGVREELAEEGCQFVRQGKGDHEIWYSPITNRRITVDGKIESRHTANERPKSAGLEKRF